MSPALWELFEQEGVQGELDLADVTYAGPPEGWAAEEVDADPDPGDVFDLDVEADQ